MSEQAFKSEWFTIVAPRVPVERCYKVIGKHLRRARLAAEMTQKEVAKASGLTRAHLANMERGEQRIWPHHVEAISRAVGAKPHKIFKAAFKKGKRNV